MTAENTRLQEGREQKVVWKKWRPYPSERQWGTVREDYRDSGSARELRNAAPPLAILAAQRCSSLGARSDRE